MIFLFISRFDSHLRRKTMLLRRLAIYGLIAFLSIAASISAHAQRTISTVAGSSWIFPASVTSAKSAPLGEMYAMAIDPAGNVFAADAGNHIIIKVTPNGTLSVAAGNGIAGFSGEGGPATSASLFFP